MTHYDRAVEEISNVIINMSVDDIIAINNKYCDKTYSDNYIYPMEMFDELLDGFRHQRLQLFVFTEIIFVLRVIILDLIGVVV